MFESECRECGEIYNPHRPGENHWHDDGSEHPGNYLGFHGNDPTVLLWLELIEGLHDFLKCELLDEYYERTWEWLEENPSITTVPDLYQLFLTHYPDWEA